MLRGGRGLLLLDGGFGNLLHPVDDVPPGLVDDASPGLGDLDHHLSGVDLPRSESLLLQVGGVTPGRGLVTPDQGLDQQLASLDI